MRDRVAAGPLVWNVAGLLADDLGADRHYPVRDAWIDLPDELSLAAPIEGTVRLAHTNRGILADGAFRTAIDGQCSRCLKAIANPLELSVEEEYRPSVDLTTGAPVRIEDDTDALRLSDHHELDLEGPVRDAISLAEPIAPVCRPDCPGLCVVCGEPLETGAHDHPDDDIDPRLAALRGFQPELE